MKSDMTTVFRQERREQPARWPIIALVESSRNPGIVERGQGQGGNADAGHEPRRPAAIIVVLSPAEAIARRDEGVIIVPYRPSGHDRGALGRRDDGALGRRFDLHEAEDVA